jgi:hypothetical protein
MGWNTYEEILADLHAARIDKPKPKPTVEQRTEERWNKVAVAERTFHQSAKALLAIHCAEIADRPREVIDFWQGIAALAETEINAAIRKASRRI